MKAMVVIVAYYAEATIADVIDRIPESIAPMITNVLVVDDGSTDSTSKISKEHGAEVIWKENGGYGSSQKVGYSKAIENGADVVIMLHGDAQYAPEDMPRILEPFLQGDADAVFGTRMVRDPLGGGMPYHKYLGNKFLTFVENLFLGCGLSEYHCGYRAYKTNALKEINFQMNSDNYVFDTEIIVQMAVKGMKIKEVEIDTHYDNDSIEISHFNSLIYGLEIFKTMVRYLLHVKNMRRYEQFE